MAGYRPVPSAVLAGLARTLLAERERWGLWLPVLLGIGIGLYFALPVQPPSWLIPLATVAALPAVFLGRRLRLWGMMTGAIIVTILLGALAADLRTAWVAAPVLERPTGAVLLEGRVIGIERLPGAALRVTFDRISVDPSGSAPLPERVRLRLKAGAPDFAVGDRLRLRALLMPPPHPAIPGGFDFARHAWFDRLGAIGTGLAPPVVLARPEETAFGLAMTVAINDLRHRLSARILAVLPGDRGAVTAALITGDQMPISATMIQAYRDSGLAHILSISGLHISLAAGLVFVGLRALLALCPPLALRYPIKKWAAALAILCAGAYTLLAGSPVPAERSFLMVALVLAAVLVDRVALSMRPLALAAMLVLVIEPEELTGPSFQMSFAAVAALIALHEAVAGRLAGWRAAHPGPFAAIAVYVVGVAVTTLVAGSVSAVFAIHHFNRFAVWSVVANMVAVPLTGFWVMPWALAMFPLLPFGLEAWALVPMGWGVEAVNRVALAVAGWPGAAITTPVLPMTGLVVFSLGGCWLVLWTRRWRWGGLVAMAAGLATMAFADPPDLLVDGRGAALAVRTEEGRLLINGKGGRVLRETWDRRAGPIADESWPDRGVSRDGRLRCDALGCRWRVGGREVALIRDERPPETACVGAAVVIGQKPLRGACRGTAVVIDRFDLWRRGAHALWFRRDGVVIETMADRQGERPWSWRPIPRRRPPLPVARPDPPAGAVESRDGGGGEGDD